jgi:glycosyltransferase involved in cell wall biosynthesis
MKKNRIAIVHHSSLIGGGSISALLLAKSLYKDFDVELIIPNKPEDLSSLLDNEKIKYRTYSEDIGGIHHYSGSTFSLSPSFFYSIFSVVRNYRNIERLLTSSEYDLIIVNSKVISWISRILKKNNIKSMCFVRETIKGSSLNFWNIVTKRYLNKFNLVSFLSKYDLERYNLNTNCDVIHDYYEVNNQINQEVDFKKEDYIFYVGGMSKIKGIDILLKAFGHIANKKVKLVIAGNPEFIYSESKKCVVRLVNKIKKRFEIKVDRIINKYNLNERIILLGVKKDLSYYYKNCMFVVFPATSPHQARPIFEAGAYKKTIIVPDYKNYTEFLDDGISGLLFKRKNFKDLAKKLEMLIEDKTLANYLGNQNFDKSMAEHSADKLEKKLIMVIEKLLKS